MTGALGPMASVQAGDGCTTIAGIGQVGVQFT